MKIQLNKISYLIIVFITILLVCGLNAQSYQNLGAFSGDSRSYGTAISSNGTIIVGWGYRPDGSGGTITEAFQWTESTGIIGLGHIVGIHSEANGISDDGNVIVGTSYFNAFRWTAGTGMVGIGSLPGGGGDALAYGISPNGLVIVGSSWTALGIEAFRWTSSGGMVGLGHLGAASGVYNSSAKDASGDGSVIVGSSLTASSTTEAFRWTSSSGMVGLGYLTGGNFSYAGAVSSDGTVIVGGSRNSNGKIEAYRWTSGTGMIGLGDLAGGTTNGSATGVSADGRIIVGTSDGGGQNAFVWDSVFGMRSLHYVMTNDYRMNIPLGTTFAEATALSSDGNSFVVNTGISPNFTAARLDIRNLNLVGQTMNPIGGSIRLYNGERVTGYGVINGTVDALGSSVYVTNLLGQTLTVNGGFTGNGTINKTGDGKVVAMGTSTHNGTVNVVEGIFQILGTMNGSVFNLSGGTLIGSASLGDVSVSSGGTLSSGDTPSVLSINNLTFGNGGIYDWKINNFTGTATNNWDFINVSGLLDITATAGSPFSLQVKTLDSFNSPGLAQNWNMNVDQAWKILSAGSINGFAANKFNIDLTGFQNPLGTGGFFISQVGNDLFLNYDHLAAIPEPSSWILLSLSMLLLIPVRKKILVKLKSRIL